MIINATEKKDRWPMSSSAHHRHAPHDPACQSHHDEESPLLVRHMSMEVADRLSLKLVPLTWFRQRRSSLLTWIALFVTGVSIFAFHEWYRVHVFHPDMIIPIQDAKETYLDVDGLQLWFRTWGNRHTGIPVLFVHGGPGNAIADYHDGNARFFDATQWWVIEVDQRGTGQSQPSVRDDWHNMRYYYNISIDQMSHDFELIRESLGIDRWLVFGGSWGSTLSLDYGMRYPEHCLGLILRGIYLNTVPEFEAVFSRRPYLNNSKRLHEFDVWFAPAAKEALREGGPRLDPNDAERFFRTYERMIERGDRSAIWHYHVFENNLMEEDPANLLDPNVIVEDVFPEAQSVAFFETRLFLHGTFEEPVRVLERAKSLRSVHTWVCQGSRDEVCPVQYAHKLVKRLEEVDAPHTARFLDAGHEDTDPVMANCLKDSLHDFLLAEENMKV